MNGSPERQVHDFPTTIGKDVDPLWQRCKPEVYDRRTTTWNDIRSDVLLIEKAHFGEKGYTEKVFMRDFNNPECTAVFLRDKGSGKIVGFSYALPADELYSESVRPERVARIKALNKRVAYIEDTVIDPAYTGHGLVSLLMSTMEHELVRKDYGYIDRDTTEANNYAAKIYKNYQGRIMLSEPHDSKYGPQVFFRIRLKS